jgi:hypothetical protein
MDPKIHLQGLFKSEREKISRSRARSHGAIAKIELRRQVRGFKPLPAASSVDTRGFNEVVAGCKKSFRSPRMRVFGELPR